MVRSIDQAGPHDAQDRGIREPAEKPQPVKAGTDNSTADPYADMELRSRHERTERVIKRARDMG